jgi:hypothetical protein
VFDEDIRVAVAMAILKIKIYLINNFKKIFKWTLLFYGLKKIFNFEKI